MNKKNNPVPVQLTIIRAVASGKKCCATGKANQIGKLKATKISRDLSQWPTCIVPVTVTTTTPDPCLPHELL
jgi:hypothetical protein